MPPGWKVKARDGRGNQLKMLETLKSTRVLVDGWVREIDREKQCVCGGGGGGQGGEEQGGLGETKKIIEKGHRSRKK